MKNFIYFLIALATFVVAFCVCFHSWADKEVFVHRVCFHRYTAPAVLVDKGAYDAGCHWKPLDRPNLDERWFTCDGYNVGETNYNYPEASFDCN
jgi:hypothetical protein